MRDHVASRPAHNTTANSASPGALLTARFLIVAVVLAAYVRSASSPFIFDDVEGIVEAPHLRRLWPLSRFLTAPPDTLTSGRPVLSLSFALNYAVDGVRSTVGYHLVNIAIHALTALLLFGFLRRLLSWPIFAIRWPGAALPIALASALLWAVHPLQTESVTYIAKRCESLMGMFYALTLYAAVRGGMAPSAGELLSYDEARARRRWQIVAVAACALGMATKETMVTAPLVLLLLDRSLVSGTFASALRARWRLYCGLAATWAVLAALVVSSPRGVTTGFGLEGLTSWTYLLTQAGVIVHYLRLVVWPWPQCVDYYDWPIAGSPGDVLLPGLLVLALLAATAWGLYRRSPVSLCGAWFFATLAPSSSVLPIREIACEYRMYLPLLAPCVLVGFALWRAGRALRGGAAARLVGPTLAGLLIVSLGAATVRRNSDYDSALAIWTSATSVRPGNWRSWNFLANELARLDRLADADAAFKRALEQKPDYAPAMMGVGNVLAYRGRLDEAADQYRRVLREHPSYAFLAHQNLGALCMAQQQFTSALDHYREACRLRPDLAAMHVYVGHALAAQGRSAEARRSFERALQLDPDFAPAQAGIRARADR
ncbi:tetratricopeptide repeat protein [Phycisphaerae bacterium RAS1]|nr:tetratricopeptide repeat protein [Phycisphaerae bacterium RAS1]